MSTADEVRSAIAAAGDAFPEWRETPPQVRARYMFRLKALMEERFEELARTIVVEHGKVIDEARGEVRREGVTEMILEPIEGLDSADYEVGSDYAVGADNAVVADPAGASDGWARRAARLEAESARFYRDAAAKLPIRQVARLFERLAKENEERTAGLGELPRSL